MSSPDEQPTEKAVLIKRRSTAPMPKPVGAPKSAPQHGAWSHLDHLYRIGKLLLKTLDNVDQTVAEVLAVMINIQPLVSATLIVERDGLAQMVLWHAEGMSKQRMQVAESNAVASYRYLSGLTDTSEVSQMESRPEKRNFIIVPLAVGRGPSWGVLQFEGPIAFSETDLTFINAIGNQLALALDRQDSSEREVLARLKAEDSEASMRFLADASRLLAVSLDYLQTWESVAELAVRHIADVCILDIVEENQSIRRIFVVSPDLPIEISEDHIEATLQGVVPEVMRTNQPKLYPEPLSGSSEGSGFCKSYMCVPLRLNERTLAAMTMVSRRPERLYSPTDLANLQDLARREVAAFENAKIYASALAAIRSRDDLIAIVSHDLKSPLAVILGYLKLFLQNTRPGERVACDVKQMEAVERSATQMNELIEDLLASASMEAATHVPFERNSYPVVPLVREMLDLVQPLAVRKGIQLKDEVPADIAPVFVDRDRISQVFGNLLGNAIKFASSGTAVTVRAEQLANEVQFSVEDAGQGIPKDRLAQVFERFWQVPGTERKGTGLGLFIVRGIVEAHGGKAWVESQEGVGSTFFFTLPTKPPEDTSA